MNMNFECMFYSEVRMIVFIAKGLATGAKGQTMKTNWVPWI